MATISGCALLVLIPFLSNASQRFQELGARCPETSSFTSGGSFSFGFGPSPPPGFTAPTPPPGFIPTPPPGFVTPPPGAFTPPAGAVGVIFEAIGLVITIGIGMALATGVATLGGLVGAATRPEPS